jgi:hypothetical protein
MGSNIQDDKYVDKGVLMDYLWGESLLLIRLETTMEQLKLFPEISPIYPESDKRTGHRIVGARFPGESVSFRKARRTNA